MFLAEAQVLDQIEVARVYPRFADLISRVLGPLGPTSSEADIQTQIYVSQGLVDRDNAYLGALLAAAPHAR